MYCVQIKSQDVFFHDLKKLFFQCCYKINCSLQKSEICDFLKALAQNTKTTFLKYRFLMIKHCLNTVKHCLPVEKDRGNACRKKQGKKRGRFFLANFFRGLSFYSADCMWSRCRDVVVEGCIIGMGNHLGREKGKGRGRSVYKQPGTRVDRGRTTRKGGIPSK